jgi:hypothetical protein
VRAVSSDCFRARAECRDHRFDSEHEINVFVAGGSIKTCRVIHHAFEPGDRRALDHEIRKFHFQVGGRRLELFLHRIQNLRDVLDVHDVAMSIEHLDESAHVRAFEFLGQIHKHANRRHRILHRMRLVADLNRKAKPPNSYLVDAQLTMITLALFIMQL